MKNEKLFIDVVSDVVKCDVEILIREDDFVRIAQSETYLLIDLNDDGKCDVEHLHPEQNEMINYTCELVDLHKMLSSSLYAKTC